MGLFIAIAAACVLIFILIFFKRDLLKDFRKGTGGTSFIFIALIILLPSVLLMTSVLLLQNTFSLTNQQSISLFLIILAIIYLVTLFLYRKFKK
ncbi:cytochrome bd-type quinol oxidase subunit 2 [Scopulibacillus daqui]|uniref:Cytochrome bd-type quinol oxidase subunit 2 n=1 Tax=Scopulibacillus daqui TaxID=1469162 RepID=A0ABS2Q119_9BACL|nr:hypothetical protein [Scopulibacillus daqui]MBM7645984.1 cytochrome bd-type quinol oxidase subunit 2 [Scopulibacillus daqui]